MRKTNESNVLIANIESVPALNHLDEILSVEGLDAVLVGPHDLTCSLGIPEQYDHPLFAEAIEEIITKARKNGVGVGIHVWQDVGFDKEISWAQKGANLIMHSNEVSIFVHAISSQLKRIKLALKMDPQNNKIEDAPV